MSERLVTKEATTNIDIQKRNGSFVHHATWPNAGAYPKLARSK